MAYTNNPKLPQVRMEAVRLLQKGWSNIPYQSLNRLPGQAKPVQRTKIKKMDSYKLSLIISFSSFTISCVFAVFIIIPYYY